MIFASTIQSKRKWKKSQCNTVSIKRRKYAFSIVFGEFCECWSQSASNAKYLFNVVFILLRWLHSFSLLHKYRHMPRMKCKKSWQSFASKQFTARQSEFTSYACIARSWGGKAKFSANPFKVYSSKNLIILISLSLVTKKCHCFLLHFLLFSSLFRWLNGLL